MFLLLILLAASVYAAPAVDCPAAERSLQRDLNRAGAAMEPESVVFNVTKRSADPLTNCPGSEILTYLQLRALELGGGAPVGTSSPAIQKQITELSSDAVSRFPKSARIATVRARATLNVEEARKAVSLDPDYGPASVALAAALLRQGDAQGALRAIRGVKNLGYISDGYKEEAQILFSIGLDQQAAAAARRQLSARQFNLVEPDAGDPTPNQQARDLLKKISAKLAAKPPS